MKIEHIAIWVSDLEIMKKFYMKYFDMSCSNKYVNKMKKFSSYFLSFDNGTRIEIMHCSNISEHSGKKGKVNGLTHVAISTGSREKVSEITKRLRNDNFTIESEPRITGDGYFESVILDPEGNHIEITE